MKPNQILNFRYVLIFLFLLLFKDASVKAQANTAVLANYRMQKITNQRSTDLIAKKLEALIQLKKRSYTLGDALKSIASQTGLKLSYSEQTVPIRKKIWVTRTKISARKALKMILRGTSLSFKVSPSGQLMLFKKTIFNNRILQEHVTGTVTDVTTDETLPGVNIRVKGTTSGTSTNDDGNYEVSTPSLQDTLIFSFIGYQTKQVPINGRDEIDVALAQKTLAVDEMVVVGYGTQQRADLTSSIATVDVNKTLESRPITDVARGLQGEVAGLTITTPSGEIGTEPNITLRGLQGSINSGGAHPLILVDGVQVDNLNLIDPKDIESISVLKDAASTSIYGSRAAWGAILIKTKLGKRNSEPEISYSNSFSWARPTVKPELAPAAEGTKMAFKALQRSNPSTKVFGVVGMYFDQESIDKMQAWQEQYGGQDLGDEMKMGRDFEIRDGRLFFYRPWDAGNKFMKDWTPLQKHNLSVSGGSESTSYNIGLGYLNQDGILKFGTDKWQRYNVNIGLNTTVNDWFDARGKFIFSQTDRTEPYTNHSSTYDTWYYLYRWPKTYPYGTYEGKPFRSSVTDIKQANDSDNTQSLSRLSVGGTAKLAPGLTFDTDFTYGRTEYHSHNVGGSVTAYNFWAGGGNLNYGTYTSSSFNNTNYSSAWKRRGNLRAVATYKKDIGDHSFKILGGGEGESYKFTSQFSERQGLLDADKGEINLANGDQFVDGSNTHWATLGFFGRVNYSYMDKYLLQVNARYDGSSRFPSNERWGFFPSVSAGYKISEESFMDAIRPILSFLKIRGSYGSVGNNSLSRYSNYPYISTMSSYNSGWLINDSETQTSFYTPGAVSSSLTWETVTTLDFGLDARLFEDQLSVSFDWYNRTTSNMLTAGVTLPSTFGTGAPRRNYGSLETRGWELEMGWNHSFSKNLYVNMKGTLSNFTEEITKFANSTKAIPPSITTYSGSYFTGRTLGDIWGYETDRLFTKNDFKQNGSGNLLTDEDGNYILKDGIPDQSVFESAYFHYGPGDVKYKDLNGDGVINYGENTVDNPGDQKVIGNSTPKYQYGFRIGGGWKGLDLSVFLQGVGKREFWADGPMFVPGYRPAEGWFKHQLDYWSPDNPDAFYPRPTNQAQSSDARNFLPQTRYLLNMAYLRMKNITLGYTLPTAISSQVHISKFRVYVSAENLFEIDHVNIPIDPETDYTSGGDNDPNTFGRIYPFQRIISVGLNMNF